MKKKLFLFDGLKAVPIDPDAEGYDWAWQVLSGPGHSTPGDMKGETAYSTIGHVRRGMTLRANAVASCPRHYYKANGEEVSEANIRFLDGWQRTLKLIELSLCDSSAFYLYRVKVGNGLAGLRWMKSATMFPKMVPAQDKTLNLVFERRINGSAPKTYTTDEIVYGWDADPYREIGPGASVLDTILLNAGALAGINAHTKAFFDRGAINPQLLQIEGAISPDEQERFKSWWKQVVAGVRNAFASEVMRFKVNKVDLSAATKDLGMPELSKAQKEDIATGLGIPYSLLFSDAANYATAQQDEANFWNLTVKPQLAFLQGELNEQVFKPAGLELYFAPEEMSLFQEDESKRSTSLSGLVAAGMPLDIAMESLGYEPSPVDEARIRLSVLLKEGLTYEAARTIVNFDEELAKNAQAQQALELFRPVPAPPPVVTSTPMVQTGAPSVTQSMVMPPAKTVTPAAEDLRKWERKAVKALAAGKSAAVTFESDDIAPALAAAISGALESATDADAVRWVFRDATKADSQAFYAQPTPASQPAPPRITVNVSAPVVNVSNQMPEQPVPTVNVAPAVVNVAAAEVKIPEQLAPVVNVAAPNVTVSAPAQPAPVVNVNVPRVAREEQVVIRDRDGNLKGSTTTVTYEGDE